MQSVCMIAKGNCSELLLLFFQLSAYSSTSCIVGFMGQDLPIVDFILGDVFLGKFYSIYDAQENRVGFAKLK